MFSVDQLVEMTETEFGFLTRSGWAVDHRRIVEPGSAKGGFALRLVKLGMSLDLLYLDMEFEARLDGREIFGPVVHPNFSGNQFSRDHLVEHLPALARAIRDNAQLS